MSRILEKNCPCGFLISNIVPSRFDRTKYCSKFCAYKYREYKPNAGQFKKGEHKSIGTEFKTGQNKGKDNTNWKGDDVSYFGLHTWVQRTLGKAKECVACGTDKGRIEWANRSYHYLRDIDDWIPLCKKCHCQYDKYNWGFSSRNFPETREDYKSNRETLCV